MLPDELATRCDLTQHIAPGRYFITRGGGLAEVLRLVMLQSGYKYWLVRVIDGGGKRKVSWNLDGYYLNYEPSPYDPVEWINE